jgi:hypothetical protein
MSNRVSRTVSDDILNRIIQIESAGNPLAKATTSSATGLFQQLDATWLSLVSMHRPQWSIGRSRAQILALRRDANLNIVLGACLTEDNQRMIGMDCTPGDLYLAHFLGPADAKDLFRAHPDTPVSALVSQSVINANKSIMQGRNAGQVRAWAARMMAKPPKEDWIGLYFTGAGPGAVAKPKPQPAPEPVEVPDAPDTPGVQVEVPLPPERPPEADAAPETAPEPPAPPVVPDPVPVHPVDDPKLAKPAKEGFGEWCGRKWKTATSAVGGFTSFGFLAYLTDWKVLATLMAGGTIIGLIIYFIYSREHRGE